MSRNSYLREFCAQESQFVFLADLTVLQKMSQNSYLREFCAQVSQNVLANLTVLRLADLTPRVVLRLITFYGLLPDFEQNVRKLISPRVLLHKCHKSCC